jgi:hypothetical protein
MECSSIFTVIFWQLNNAMDKGDRGIGNACRPLQYLVIDITGEGTEGDRGGTEGDNVPL